MTDIIFHDSYPLFQGFNAEKQNAILWPCQLIDTMSREGYVSVT